MINTCTGPKGSDQGITAHYDEEYYGSHYGQLLANPAYARTLARFYDARVFKRYAPTATRWLDFGAGHGCLSTAINADCYDPSEFACQGLAAIGRVTYWHHDDLPKASYDAVFSSHALEHAIAPASELKLIHDVLRDDGQVILILPIEAMPGRPQFAHDNDRHFYSWSFQNITNLLLECGFDILRQEVFYGPFMLQTLSKRMSIDAAIKLAAWLGIAKRQYPSTLNCAVKKAKRMN